MNQISAASLAVCSPTTIADEAEEPPSSAYSKVQPSVAGPRVGAAQRHERWKNVPLEQWEDWRWQMQHAIRTTAQVVELLPHAPHEIAALESLEAQYKLAIPPYYFSLIDVDNSEDPIRLQSVPTALEMTSQTGIELEDPLEEDKDSPVPGLTHRYPDRVLLVTTHVCTMYCRFCTRKRVTMDRDGWDAPSHNDQRMIQYVREHSEIHDVIVSGGDPLSLPLSKLRWFVTELAAIPHVDVIRIGTRVPVTLPQRLFDPELVDLLGQAGKIWIQTHFNHPREITPESARAVRNLVNAGMPVNNHSVLLKGVNDSVSTMRELVRGLLRIKVRPYYLFHCDPVVGAGHLRTSVWKGLEIIEGLRGHVSGLAVPTYVVDGLHGAGKIPLMPNYLVSACDNAVVLRNYEGLLFRYSPEDKVPEPRGDGSTGGYESQGVSNLLSGNQGFLMPEGNRRMARRKANQAQVVDLVVPANAKPPMAAAESKREVHANGAAATNGKSPSAKAAKSGSPANGSAKVNGTSSNGSHSNGSPSNGSPSNGSASNGSGTKTNGAVKSARTVASKPAATNGTHGAARRNGHSNAHSNGSSHGSATSVLDAPDVVTHAAVAKRTAPPKVARGRSSSMAKPGTRPEAN